MKPAINCITLPVDDLKKSLAFYRDGLGLPAQFSAELKDGADRTAFELAVDLWLVLMPRAEFAKCTKIAHQPDAPRGSSECILSYFAASKEDVDAILKRANAAGGAVPGEAEERGYSGYFTDPDGHLWEIMWKPALVGDATHANRKHGVAPEVGAISFMRVLPGPIERVWAYLTVSEKRGKWFAFGPMELRAGGRVELHFLHANLFPRRSSRHRSAINNTKEVTRAIGRVNRCEPPRLLSFMWAKESGDDSEVAIELIPCGENVLLMLTHRRLGDRGTMVSVASGWHTHLGILIDHLDGRVPPPFWSTHVR